MTPKEVLTKAADLLESSPNAWIQNRIALDHTGWEVRANSPIACQWCALGAIAKVQGLDSTEYSTAASLLAIHLKCGSVANWNDSPFRTREQVIAALRGATAV
jgi:hypothetical protein